MSLLENAGRRTATVAAAFAMVAGFAAPSQEAGLFQRIFGGGQSEPSTQSPLVVDPETLNGPLYCPELHLSIGGEAWASFDKGHDSEGKYAHYLGSISQTARECHSVTDTGISLKVGVAGRVMAGPKGTAGKVNLPIRVTVVKQHGAKVLFDKVYTATVTVGGPGLTGDFTQVIDPISFKRTANDEDLIVYVGFDRPKPADVPTG